MARSKQKARVYTSMETRAAAPYEKLLRAYIDTRYRAIAGQPVEWQTLATKQLTKVASEDVTLEKQTLTLKGDALNHVDFTLSDLVFADAGKVMHVRVVERYIRRMEAIIPAHGELRGIERHEFELVKRRKGWLVASHRHEATNEQRLAAEAKLPDVELPVLPSEDDIEKMERRRALKISLVKGLLILLLLLGAVGYLTWNYGPREALTTVSLQTGRQHLRETVMDYVIKDEDIDTDISLWVDAQAHKPTEEFWYPHSGYSRSFMAPAQEIQSPPQVKRAMDTLEKIRNVGTTSPLQSERYLRRYLELSVAVEATRGDEQRDARKKLDALLRELDIK